MIIMIGTWFVKFDSDSTKLPIDAMLTKKKYESAASGAYFNLKQILFLEMSPLHRYDVASFTSD